MSILGCASQARVAEWRLNRWSVVASCRNRYVHAQSDAGGGGGISEPLKPLRTMSSCRLDERDSRIGARVALLPWDLSASKPRAPPTSNFGLRDAPHPAVNYRLIFTSVTGSLTGWLGHGLQVTN